jgi:hypothetical protein
MDDIITQSNAPVFRFDGRGALGYNGRIFFTGCIINVTGISFEQGGTTAINTDTGGSYQIFAGIRLNATKILREKVALVDKLKK